ncbi:MAG: endonuclease/exonuclease/phosphatase family protein [Polyangiales bacterium]|nr:endonuclease/exonuclease/phosphatase family protein [Myxococcales bacterium]
MLVRTTRMTVVVGLLSFLSACDDGGGTADAPDLTVTTFNAGLAAGFVPYAPERAPKVYEKLAGLDTDVLCVQEIWTAEDWSGLRDAASEKWADHYRLDDSQELAGTCESGELDDLETCVDAECNPDDVEGLASCALDKCRTEFDALSANCNRCLIAQVGNTLDDIKTACLSGEPMGIYAYGGSFGTGLLSKYTLEDKDEKVFLSTANRRAALHGRIDGVFDKPLHVFCTHLTANLSDVPYTGELESWEKEQATQIRVMLQWVNSKIRDDDGYVVLLGDLNCGPEGVAGIDSELPDNYKLFADADYANPYLAQSPECTFCDSNPLLTDAAGGEGGLIDHILSPSSGALDFTVERTLDETFKLEVDGEDVDAAYSDHYALRGEIRAK